MLLAEKLWKFITRESAAARSRTSVELELFVRIDTCQLTT